MFYIIAFGEKSAAFGPFERREEANLFINMMKTLDDEYTCYIIAEEIEKGLLF